MNGRSVPGVSIQGIMVQGIPLHQRQGRAVTVQGKSARATVSGIVIPLAEVPDPPQVPEPPQPAVPEEFGGDVELGILMQPGERTDEPFGGLTLFARTVTTLARSEGVRVSAFGPDDIDLERRVVRVRRFLSPQAGWREEETGLPDVIWNRCLRRDQEGLMQELMRRGVPLVNEGWLNKWEAYQCLMAGDGAFRECLPATQLLTRARVATELLEEHPVIFIKPVAGSVGRGIMRGRREGPGLMRLEYVSRETGSLREIYASEEQFDRWLAGEGRMGRYIVQQGLSLTVFHGRPADVRVLVQKDGQGRWQVTGMGCRVAGHGRFTANLHTGGQAVSADLLTEAVAPDDRGRRQAILEELEALALQAAFRIEQGAGPLGEIGLDFGIDERGKIWYIEQNGQPGRSIFEHLGRWDLWDLAHLQPIRYARHLATIKTARAAGGQAT